MLPVIARSRLGGPLGGLRELAPLPRRPRLRTWLPLLLVLLLVLAGLGLHRQFSGPESLIETRLAGPRAPMPLSVVILVDESGSFTEFEQMRIDLLQQLATWAPQNLRPDDVITVISFACDAQVKMSATTVAELQSHGPRYQPVSVDPACTSIQPALEKALDAAPKEMATTLVVMSDTYVSDANDEATRLATDLRAQTMTLIFPDAAEVITDWQRAFEWEQTIQVDPGSVNETGVALADALAHATRQTVTKT